MDTRTPRTPGPSGGRPKASTRPSPSGFYDDDPVLSTVRVPSDPAEVVVSHASFRVQLTPPGGGGAGQRPIAPTSVTAASDPAGADLPPRRRGAVDWGRTEEAALRPAGEPQHGVRGGDTPEPAAATTQVLPRVEEDAGRPRHDGPRRRPGHLDGERGYERDRFDLFADDLDAPLDGERRGSEGTTVVPTVVGQRSRGADDPTRLHPLLEGVRPARSAFDTGETTGYRDDPYGQPGQGGRPQDPYGEAGFDFEEISADDHEGEETARREGARRGSAGAHAGARRQSYYPGRRMNLGVVLLPLRIFLGFISVYAGMGKLCDPVYFDGHERGSMVRWLGSLEPWALASPLHDFAVAHPVGAGLTVAFVQIIVGVLTVCGLWQRAAASLGALLSAALLMTVSWSHGPAYDAPDIIYLAAWSPLIIAGAPVYSIDGKLATDAWRKLGPRAGLWELRRRVLRRGTVIASVVTGVALLTGSLLGGAVRSAQMSQVPEPGEPPVNRVPGSPLPKDAGKPSGSGLPTNGQGTQGPESRRSGGPSAPASPGEGRIGGPETPSQRETVQAPQQTLPGAQPPQQSEPGAPATSGGGGVTGGGGSGTGGGGGSNSGGTDRGSASGSGGGSSTGGSGSGGGLGGLLG